MSKKDYIEKITQNLEHLTKDELKDVSILTTAQLGVRLKFAERQQLEKEIANLTPQIQQQALPVVPECVAKFINTKLDKSKNLQDLYDEPLFHTGENYLADDEYDFIHWFNENTTLFEKAWTNGFTVEKPQLFYIKLPNVYGLSDSVFVSKVKSGTILEFTKGKDYALALTEQEIKSIDERYWQFAVPVEDGE